MRRTHLHYLLYLLIAIPLLNACSLQPVQPWERDILAERKMQLTPHPLESYLDEHIYFSKEASSGGAGVGGGGCGCN